MADLNASGVNMELYHGSQFGSDLQLGTIDPLKHSSGRTPLPAFTMTDRAGAESYARTGGPGQSKAFAGPLYKMDVQFDSPTRIVGAYDQASDDFVDFMRNSLPEESVRAPLVPGGKTGIAKPREIFDQSIESLVKSGDRTNYAVMDALSTLHEIWRPLGDYDYLPRAQGSIEARRFGIDALTWNDFGDDVVALLDPEDLRSNVGRKNIASITEVDMLSPAAASGPTTSTNVSLDDIRKAIPDNESDNTSRSSTKDLTPEQQSKLDEVMKAQKQHKEAVLSSVDPTKKAIEQDGYLYHYAPREARESILSEGLLPSKASTGDVLDNGIYFFTNPKDAPSASSVMAVSGRTSADSPGLDLYRVKITPDMLDEMVVDSKLPIRGNVASAVVVPTKTGSFIPELIGENARFESSGELMDLFSKADYDSIHTPVSPQIEAKVVSENVVSKPTGEPVSPASESVDKAKTARKGPSDLGTAADIKTKPTVDGAKRPTVDIPAPPANGTSVSSNNATAAVTTNAPKVSPDSAPPSSGAPRKAKSLMDDAFDTARNVAKGTGNARNLGIIGAATLLGAGAFTMRKKSEEDMQRRMDLQRYGEIK